jgi:hypothetical protein
MLVPAYAATIRKSEGSEMTGRCHPGRAPYDATAESVIHRHHPRQKKLSFWLIKTHGGSKRRRTKTLVQAQPKDKADVHDTPLGTEDD